MTREHLIVTELTRPFWDGIAQRRFLLQFDPATRRYQFYPRPLSLSSLGPLEWRESCGEGRLLAVTTTHFPAPRFKDRLPYVQGIVQLHEGPRVFANLKHASAAGLKLGQRMRVVYPDADDNVPFYFETA